MGIKGPCLVHRIGVLPFTLKPNNMQKLTLVFVCCAFCMMAAFAGIISAWKTRQQYYTYHQYRPVSVGAPRLYQAKFLYNSLKPVPSLRFFNGYNLQPENQSQRNKLTEYHPLRVHKPVIRDAPKEEHAYAHGISEHDGRVWFYMNEN